jgi:starch phosphorylase
MQRNVRPAALRSSLSSRLPAGLEALASLAPNLRWTWCHRCDALWSAIDPDAWERTQNPWLILQDVSAARLEALARDPVFLEALHRVEDEWRRELGHPTWMQEAHPGAPLGTIGYFSLEFGFGEALPLYAGGLGVLAADHLKAASDLGVPVVGVGLLYQEGYFRQSVDPAGAQRESYPYNDPYSLPIEPLVDAEGGWAHVHLALPGRRLALRVWRATAGNSTLLLLDSNDPLNAPADRGITGKLYGGGPEVRLLQELTLGVGGWRALAAAGIDPDVCHLNEGHAAFAAVERARSFAVAHQVSFERALWATRAGNVFTTHTPVAAGFDRFPPALVTRYFPALELDQLGVGPDALLAMGRSGPDRAEPFNLAYLALRTCGRANAVSRLHGEVSRQLFRELYPRWPVAEVPVTHVTNGVHVPTWDSAAADRLWTDRCGPRRWVGDQRSIETALDGVSDEELWAFRTESRHELIRYARARLAQQLGQQGADALTVAHAAEVLDPNALTLGFARRFATYKRPNLLLHDPERLVRLLTQADRPVQIVVAGKAHPDDAWGKALVQAWAVFVKLPAVRAHAVFLEDYDLALAQRLVAGVDVWLNTPLRPWEACGTSGMKVLVNGGLNVSELDGWWPEAWSADTGWALHGIGDDAQDSRELFDLLEGAVVPAFHARDEAGIPREWTRRMRASMARLTPRFSANRMIREYVEQLYLPAATGYRHRTEDGARVARDLVGWRAALDARWGEVHVGNVSVEEGAGGAAFTAQVYTGELPPDAIRAELYADPRDGGEPARITMERDGPMPGAVNASLWRATVPPGRPAADYTVRVVPHHPDALVPAEERRILWQR